MRRLVPIAAFALFLAVPLWAQHGGGHSGGGGHAGGSGGHAGFGGGHGGGFSGGHMGNGGHASGGMRSSPGAGRGFSRGSGLSQRGFSHQSFRNNGRNTFRSNGFRGRNRFRTFGLRNCIGFGCRGFGYPWAYGGYYDPYWWWNSDSSYDDSYDQDRAIANDMNAQSLDEQRMLRQEEADGDQDSYASSAPHSRPAPNDAGAASGSAIAPPTVLVFRDQHKQEIRNYAIVGQTLWNFSPQRTEKIPIADLDLTATSKANDDRGLSFHVPDSSQAQ